VINRSSQAAIARGGSLMVGLRGRHRGVPLPRVLFLFSSRSGSESTFATVIAHTVCSHVIDERLRVRVMDDGAVHVHD
jgi:hypothetical protein